MNDDQFEKILEDFDTNTQHAAQQRTQKRSEDAALVGKFADHANNQIEPALTDIGLKVRQHGHDFKIRLHDSKQSVTFEFFPKNIPRGEFRHENTPSVTFAWDTLRRKVSVHGSNVTPRSGGEGRPHGHFEVTAITPDFVRERAMKLVEEVLSKRTLSL